MTTARSGRKGTKALAEIGEDDDINVHGDAVARYNRQKELVRILQEDWEKMGKPATTLGGANGKTTVVHPLVKEIQEAEALADRLLQRTLEKRKVGRPAGSSSAGDRPPRGVQRIRKVA